MWWMSSVVDVCVVDVVKSVEPWGENKKLAAHLNHIKEIKKPINPILLGVKTVLFAEHHVTPE